MRVIEVRGNTEKTKNYSPCNFYIGHGVDGDHIMSDGAFGFTIRTDITTESLHKHLLNLRSQGFSVREYDITC